MGDILIVDDSLTVRMDLKQAFEAAGLPTVECATVADARRELAKRPVGLVILDVLLPDGDGVDFMAELKRNSPTAGIPVILLASESEVADRIQTLRVAPEEYVGKPYDRDYVVSRADELTGRAGVAQEGEVGASDEAFPPKRILAVDDSPTYLNALAEQLRHDGYDVVTASSGEEALQRLSERPVDCVLLDLIMPGLSGVETCRRIKGSASRRAIPVLMLTAREDREATLSSFSAGADDYIPKSGEFSVLRARLRAQLRRKQFEDENRRMREELHRQAMDAAEAKANREARKLAQQWQTTFDAISDGVALLDDAGRVVRANGSLDCMVRVPVSGVEGTLLIDLLPMEWRPQIQALLASPQQARLLVELSRRATWYSLTLDRVTLPDGELSGFVCILSDVTARKRAEQDLKEAMAAAESANAAKDRFLAVLSHELRTPLTPVLMAVSVLSDDPGLPPELRDDIWMIRRNVELEVRLIDDLLDLSRIIHGKLSLHPKVHDVHVKLQNAVDMCRADMEAKSQQFVMDLQAADVCVEGDAGRLQQVFWNVLRNAAKFTPEGGRIELRTCNPRPGWIRVEVADTGIGIVPERLPGLFKAFEQESTKITREFGGLGLGLAIAKALVEMHRGAITARSAGRNQGATLTIDLPTVAAPATVAAEETSGETPDAPKPRILLVEDHGPTAQVMTRLLTREGYKVTRAADVKSALKLAAGTQFELLISDLGLPDGSGLEVMRELKARHKNLVGIALTGFGMQDDMDRSRQAGFAEHLTKPVDFKSLQATIERLMQA